jgi:hypothetical protein
MFREPFRLRRSQGRRLTRADQLGALPSASATSNCSSHASIRSASSRAASELIHGPSGRPYSGRPCHNASATAAKANAGPPARPPGRDGLLVRLLRGQIDERKAATSDHLAHNPDKYLLTVAERASVEELAQMKADFEWIAQRNREEAPRRYVEQVLQRAAQQRANRAASGVRTGVGGRPNASRLHRRSRWLSRPITRRAELLGWGRLGDEGAGLGLAGWVVLVGALRPRRTSPPARRCCRGRCGRGLETIQLRYASAHQHHHLKPSRSD